MTTNTEKLLARTLKFEYGICSVSRLMDSQFVYENEDSVYAMNLLSHVLEAFKEQHPKLNGTLLQCKFEEYLEWLWSL